MIKRGSTVVCINAGGTDITNGKTYIVIDMDSSENWVNIKNDAGNKCWYFTSRFVEFNATPAISIIEKRLILNLIWDKICDNRKKNLSDMSDESQPLWELKRKVESIL